MIKTYILGKTRWIKDGDYFYRCDVHLMKEQLLLDMGAVPEEPKKFELPWGHDDMTREDYYEPLADWIQDVTKRLNQLLKQEER